MYRKTLRGVYIFAPPLGLTEPADDRADG